MRAPPPAAGAAPPMPPFEAFDQLATMVAAVAPDGRCLQANAALENTLGASRRTLQRGNALDWLADPAPLRDTLGLVARNQVATSRFDAQLRRIGAAGSELPVHVIVNQTESPSACWWR
jgi:two-component system, NtrC family, nitrogen regulation sensor histidine kinase GlnL